MTSFAEPPGPELSPPPTSAMIGTDSLAGLGRSPRNDFDPLTLLAREFRRPLRVILRALSVLDHASRFPGAVERERMTITRQVGQLSILVEDLEALSSLANGPLEIRRERLDVRALVALVVDSCQWWLTGGGWTLSLQLPPREMGLYADPDRMGHVIRRVLDNAARGAELFGHVDLIVEHVGNEIELRVEGDGLYKPSDELLQALAAAEQPPGASTRWLGYYKGLVLTKHIVELHGGTLRVHSNGPGRKTSLAVRIPAVSSG